MQLVQGLVRPEDVPAAEANDDDAQNGTGHDDAGAAGDGTSSIQAPSISGPAMPPARPDPEAEARKDAGVGIGLGDDLRSIRTALVKAHLAGGIRGRVRPHAVPDGARGVHPRLPRPTPSTSRCARPRTGRRSARTMTPSPP